MTMRSRLKLIIAYDGTGFAGWQSQSHRNAIQDHVERAFERISGESVRVHGAGRTDAASTPWRNAHMSIFQTIGYRLRVGQLRSMHCYHRPSAYFAANTFLRIFTPAIPLKAKSIATESGLLTCYRHSNMAAPGMCHSHSISRF